MKLVIIGGPPGVGKGTQAAILKGKGYQVMPMGETLKRMARENPDDSRFDPIKNGKMVEDTDLVVAAAVRFLEECKRQGENFDRICYDGFPRTLEQAEAFHKEMAAKDIKPVVIWLEAVPAVLKTHLSARIAEAAAGKAAPRDEDEPETFEERQNEYAEKTLPVKEFFSDKGVLWAVPVHDDKDSKERVHRDICGIIDCNDGMSVPAARNSGGPLPRPA